MKVFRRKDSEKGGKMEKRRKRVRKLKNQP
jgi:hypothetical protein